MLEVLKRKLRNAIKTITRKSYIDDETLSAFIKDVERGLLLSDVRVEDVSAISERIKKRLFKEEALPGLTKREHLIKIVYEELVRLLGGEAPVIKIDEEKQTIIMLVGLQGSGKTTTVGKLAYFFKKSGYDVGVVCADTYRRGAQEQLKKLAEEAGVTFFISRSKNVLEIVKDAKNQLSNKKIIIFDTAGRHKEEEGLLREMKEISRIINPTITFLVVDATIGQQAYFQARAFHEATSIGGIIITKMDGTARGGGALSASIATGARVYFIGTGEKIDDIEPYDPKSFVSRLLGLGDIVGLIRKVERLEKKIDLRKMEKVVSGKLTLIDFIEQMEKVRKIGSFKKILDFLPISSINIPSEKLDELSIKVEKWRYAVDSMTMEERLNPEIIAAQRVKRISRGAGVEERDVRELLKQYRMIKKTLRGRGKKLLKLLKKRGMHEMLNM